MISSCAPARARSTESAHSGAQLNLVRLHFTDACRRGALSAIVLGATLSGCSGGLTAVRADTSRYPISMSDGGPHQDGRVLHEANGLEVVGEVKRRYRRWFTLYGAVPGHQSLDVSSDLNTMIASAGGDAITDFSVGAKQCGANYIPFLRVLPFWVGCVVVDIEGKIVKVHD
jgi:hypothetical protein